MQEPMTPQEIDEEYIKTEACPCCGGIHTEWIFAPKLESREVICRTKCYSCHSTWDEVYWLAGITNIRDER